MSKYVVAISVEKIQKYIYSILDDRDVIKQRDKGTLKSIIVASNAVYSQIDKIIKKEFTIKEENKILWISGKFIFTTETNEEGIKSILNEIFRDVYLKYSGNIFLNYALLEYDQVNGKFEAIKKSIEKLKKNTLKTRLILQNHDILFEMNKVKKLTVEDKDELPDYMNVYVGDMDSLVDYKDTEKDGTNGKIAIVKADINDLGQFFMENKDYDRYIRVSNYFKGTISLEYFAKKLKERNLCKKVLPIYIAGDDIFYAVKIDAVLDTIKVLKEIIEAINEELKKILPNHKNGLSLAVGCVFVNNHQPIRYYRDAVEKELSTIKNKMKDDNSLKKTTILGLKILDSELYFYKKGYKENNNLNIFIREISDLKWLIYHKRFLTNSFMYKLIYGIEHAKDKKNKMNFVLHHLRPVLGLSENFIYDMLLKHYFLSFLTEDKKHNKDNTPKREKEQNERKFLPENIDKKLLPRLKLIAMLLDEKYNSRSLVGVQDDNKYKYEGNLFKVKSIKANLFNRPLNYLSDNRTNLTKLFLEKVTLNKGEDDEETLYKKLRIDKGCLFKCKKLIDSGKSDLVFDVIQNNISIKKVEESDDNLPTSKHIKDFSTERDKFDELVKVAPNDWIDEVIIYYEYVEQRKRYSIEKSDFEKELRKYKPRNTTTNKKNGSKKGYKKYHENRRKRK